MNKKTYKQSGVDRLAAGQAISKIADTLKNTRGPQVISGANDFGALYHLTGYDDPVLVSSTDGVGTKLKLAIAMERYDTIGEDLVNACINDVIVSGAQPLFFLDYIAVGRLNPDIISDIVAGMGRACQISGCALIGGEMAEMPGLYSDNDFDLAGFAVGAVERSNILDAQTVREGDVLVGIPSNGLHTNGFSLVRMALELDIDSNPLFEYHDTINSTLGEALLKPHRPYWPLIKGLLNDVKSIAHITGGGLIDNVPRALSAGLGAKINASTWSIPPIFSLLEEVCRLDIDEMYQVFNMGIGLVLVCGEESAKNIISTIDGSSLIGEVVVSSNEEVFIS